MSLPTPPPVETLQKSLHVKAKTEPQFRFYSLWDKVYRTDVLSLAYRKSRRNRGVSGTDGVTFESIESYGLEKWLRELKQELQEGSYTPQPLLRVWIPKAKGGQRPLGIPTIKDRVVQYAATIVLEPIFEADFQPSQYGFRPNLDAKMAVRKVFFHLTQYRRTEVVDADLRDYFNEVPHGELMRSISRRISDGSFLGIIKKWLQLPTVEKKGKQYIRKTEARDLNRGTPQGSPCSPLFANIYFRRFVVAWERFGLSHTLNAHIVNYADDFVICTKPGRGEEVYHKMCGLMRRLGLEVNDQKTRIVSLPRDSFDFLGYSFGKFYGKGGRGYIGTQPSTGAVQRVMRKIHFETSRRWLTTDAEKRVLELNRIVRGWCNYYNQGPVLRAYRRIERYRDRRLRRWLVRKHKQRGTGYRQYPDSYLYSELKLYKLPLSRAELSRAKT